MVRKSFYRRGHQIQFSRFLKLNVNFSERRIIGIFTFPVEVQKVYLNWDGKMK